jgi:hypothetical protein
MASAPGPTIKMSTAIWSTWWRIAEERATASAVAADRNEGFGEVMSEAMVAIVAAASALGGLAASVREHSETARVDFAEGTPPEAKILETLKRGFSVGAKADEWYAELKWLFGLRDPLVHPIEALREPVPHPDRPEVRVSVEAADYSATNARKAVALVRDVVKTCCEHPKPAFRDWCEARAKLIRMRLNS